MIRFLFVGLFALLVAPAFAEESSPKPFDVCLILAPRPALGATQESREEFGEEVLRLMEARYAELRGAPFTIWFEQASVPGTPGGVGEMDRFFESYGKPAGLTTTRTAEAFFGFDPSSAERLPMERMRADLKRIYYAAVEGLRAEQRGVNGNLRHVRLPAYENQMLVEHAARQEVAGVDASVAWEMPPYEAWVASLREDFKSAETGRRMREGDVEAAAGAMFSRLIYGAEAQAMRDEGLANEIAGKLADEPERVFFVIRGAAHSRLKDNLAAKNISVRVMRSSASTSRLDEEERALLGPRLALGADAAKEPANAAERNLAMRELMFDIIVRNTYASSGRLGPRDIAEAVGNIDALEPEDIEDWARVMARPPKKGEGDLDLRTASWLNERPPRIRKHVDA